MCYCEYSAIFEFIFDDFLYKLIIFHINVGGCLIYDDNFAVFEKGSTYAK